MGVAIVLGAGDGLGGAVAERFAKDGLHVVLVRRDLEKARTAALKLNEAGYSATARNEDVRDPSAVERLFEFVESEIGPTEACIYNAGANVQKPLLETTPKLFRQVWELGCFGGFLAARECARVMAPRGRGALLFTSATSGIYGRAGFVAFSSAKFGLRAVAQASARELGPMGVHVAHVVIDCGLRTEAIRRRYTARGVDIDTLPEGRLAAPESVAEQYWMLTRQPKDAWTHELDLRPSVEPW